MNAWPVNVCYLNKQEVNGCHSSVNKQVHNSTHRHSQNYIVMGSLCSCLRPATTSPDGKLKEQDEKNGGRGNNYTEDPTVSVTSGVVSEHTIQTLIDEGQLHAYTCSCTCNDLCNVFSDGSTAAAAAAAAVVVVVVVVAAVV